MKLTSKACGLFLGQPASGQRKLIELITQDATWQDGELRMMFRELFEQLRLSNFATPIKKTQTAVLEHFLRSGGEGGIRTPDRLVESASYRFQVANVARDARDAVDHCTLLHAGPRQMSGKQGRGDVQLGETGGANSEQLGRSISEWSPYGICWGNPHLSFLSIFMPVAALNPCPCRY